MTRSEDREADGLVQRRKSPGVLELADLTPILFGHAAFQYLHAGCVLGVFEVLERSDGLTAAELASELGLARRSARCLLLGLTSLGLLEKPGDQYRNCGLVRRLIADRARHVVHDTTLFQAQIVYAGLEDLVPSLKKNTNVGLRRIPGNGSDLYRRLAADSERQQTFFRFMSSWSRAAAPLLLDHYDFASPRHVFDAGCGDATNALLIAEAHPHLSMTLFDLPDTARIARGKIAERGLSDRLDVLSGDLFKDPFPEASTAVCSSISS